MKNALNLLSSLVNSATRVKRQLSIVLGQIGESLWLVEDTMSGGQQVMEGSGLEVGDYVLHENQRLVYNLGVITITVKSV